LTNNKEKANRQTHKETTKTAQEKHKWKGAECDHVEKEGKKKSSEAESFKQTNIKYPTHLKMAT
jgi:hypothetical protein